MPKTDLCLLTATELAVHIKAGRVSPVDVVEALDERIGRLNPDLVAYLHVSSAHARAAAEAAAIEIRGGGYRGPLHGIPVAYKDIYHVQGMPTTAGSRLLAGYVADSDATVAARLRAAGAICLGKLNTIEFASGSMEVYGVARNPWNTTRFPGGSSSGSGVALAAHLVPLATGSDTGGSIRGPAALCGVVGLKPTYGRVSRAGVLPLSWSLDHTGPMARTVADAALMLQGMAGADPADPTTAPFPVPDYTTALRRDLRGVRLGVPRSFYFDHGDPEVLGIVRGAIAEMERLGATVREIDLDASRFGGAASWAVAYTEAYAYHRDNFFRRSREYTPAFLHKIAAAACLTAEERLTAQRIRQLVTSEFLAALQDVDAIVTPASSYAAHAIDGPAPQADVWSTTRPVSLTGLPALSLPCGFTSQGLPVGLQVVGRAWEEGTVLGIGHAYEQATGWYTRRAPITARPVTDPPGAEPPASDAATDAQWVLDYARLTGMSFVVEADAPPIARALSPVRALLNEARLLLDPDLEPPVRPVMQA